MFPGVFARPGAGPLNHMPDPGLNGGIGIRALVGVALVAVVATFFLPAIPQDPQYHLFADDRLILGIPNFWNVVSNVFFLPIGGLGLFLVLSDRCPAGLGPCRLACGIFFAGFALVGVGSAWYHLNPSNDTLLWDRLPMSIAFMAFFSFILGTSVSPGWGRRLLLPLILVGAGSVVYWRLTETAGRGDLRLYALVQFLPMVLVPIMLWKFRSGVFRPAYIWGMLGFYLASKLAEWQDARIYSLLQVLSGHSVKHALAAVAGVLFYLALVEPAQVSDAKR